MYILDDTNRSAGEKSLKPALTASNIMGIKSIFILELMKIKIGNLHHNLNYLNVNIYHPYLQRIDQSYYISDNFKSARQNRG